MSFKYWKKKLITIWASNKQVMDFLCLLFFADMQLLIDRKILLINRKILSINRKILLIDQTSLILTF